MKPVLHVVWGKIAAGKSTLAAKLSEAPGTVMMAEDDWLAALYPEPPQSIPEHFQRSANLRRIIGPHVTALLNVGVSVVLDFQANTVESRAWFRSILEGTDADNQLHVLDVPDEVCLERLTARNATGNHPFAPTVEEFHRIATYVVPPSDEEGFILVRHN